MAREKNNDVVKSNAFIEASYEPGNVYRMRVLVACLEQIKAGEPLSSNRLFEVTATGLADITGVVSANNYRSLRQAVDSLIDMSIIVHTNPDGTKLGSSRRKMNIVSYCDYFDKQGRIALKFTDDIIPYISDLRTRFTKYKSKYVMHMRSGYGIRLYELCLQWLGNEREFTVEEFRFIFALGKKYPRLDNLKRRVIEPAIEDINKHTDIKVTAGYPSRGNHGKITHIQFIITKPEPSTVRSRRLTRDEEFKEWGRNAPETKGKSAEEARAIWNKIQHQKKQTELKA